MNQVLEKSLPELGFLQNFKNAYAEVYSSEEHGAVACVLTADYVPIKFFIETFQGLSRVIQKGEYHKFIFDKRALRTFHQPSMQWYFLDWKTEVLDYGITKHRKILPELPWFVKAVEIARDPLLEKMPEEVKGQLDIKYCSTLEDTLHV